MAARETSRAPRVIGAVLLALWFIALMRLTVLRNGVSLDGLFQNGQLSLVPIVGIIDLVKYSAPLTVIYLIGGNIAWFMPLGALLPIVSGGRIRFFACIGIGLALSAVIEFLQYMLGVGITETDDLLLNTIGTALGYAVYAIILRIVRAKRAPSEKA